MMTGELMSSGYDLVSMPYSRKLESNNALNVNSDHNDVTELLRFLGSAPCRSDAWWSTASSGWL